MVFGSKAVVVKVLWQVDPLLMILMVSHIMMHILLSILMHLLIMVDVCDNLTDQEERDGEYILFKTSNSPYDVNGAGTGFTLTCDGNTNYEATVTSYSDNANAVATINSIAACSHDVFIDAMAPQPMVSFLLILLY